MMQVREKYHQVHQMNTVSCKPASTEGMIRFMAKDEDDLQIAYMREQLQACFMMIKTLEKEKHDLQNQVQMLKSHVGSCIRTQDVEIDVSKPPLKTEVAVEGGEVKTFNDHTKDTNLESKEEKLQPKTSDLNRVLQKREDGKKMLQATLPPPPPPPLKMLPVKSKAVRRMPEVIEFYRSLTRKDSSSMESKSNVLNVSAASFSKNMIGEIENRSTYLMAIKSDVETRGEFISFLTREVAAATYSKISDVEAFVKWLDGELSCLVEERAVLRHFPNWPERKADTLREAACTYRDLKNIENEILSYKVDQQETSTQAFSRMQALQQRLELRVCEIERTKESLVKKYREVQLPYDWIHEMVIQLKLSSMKLAKHYMARTMNELRLTQGHKQNEMLLQGVRFAYRVHQFAGGFDAETTKAFEELRQFRSQTKNW